MIMNKMYGNNPNQQQQQQLHAGSISVPQSTVSQNSNTNPGLPQQTSAQSSQRAVKKQGSKQQPMIVLQQSKIPNAQGSLMIKKEDLKFIQQYVESDLNMEKISKNAKHQQQVSHHKTKSEGATPLATNYIKTHYQGKSKMQPIPFNMINQAPSSNPGSSTGHYHQQNNQSPFLDYQKFLEDEKIFQNQKAKSSMGYYSIGQNPQNISAGGRPGQQSKSPDLSIQIKAAHYKSQKHNQNVLAGSALGSANGPLAGHQPNMISQSALASYSNVQNLLQQHSNRGTNGGQQTSQAQSVTRPSSRKKQNQAAAQNLIYDQQSHSVYPSYNAPGTYNQKNQAFGNSKAQSVLLYNNDDLHSHNHQHNNHSTIEGAPKDQYNESQNYLSDDPLMKSNKQLQNVASKSSKSKQQQHFNQNQYSSLQDESYLDASVYEQFIQGPHNISQFTAGVSGNAHKMLEDINSYSQYIQRPLSQNTNLTKNQSKLGRQSPAHKNNTTRSGNAQMNNSQPKKQQRSSSIMHSSLNNSGQKQQAAFDRRLVVGRTPSPNFLKRIAGLMSIGNDFILPQSNLQKNQNNASLIVGSLQQQKRSQSKQAFSTNPSSQYHQPIQQNFIHIGSNTIQSLDKSIKQKYLKNNTSTSNASTNQQLNSGPGSILALGNATRFKSGSLTTSANTAQNSPRRDSVPINRNQAKHQKTTSAGKNGGNQPSAYHHSNTDIHSLSEAIKKNQMAQVLQQINPQQKLKIINDIEEKKAMALVKGIKDYPSVTTKQQQHLQLQQQQAYLQQQFLQPVKMIGEILEEEPQPLSSQEFMDEEKSFQSDLHQNNYYPQANHGKHGKKKQVGAPGHKANSKSISHTPNNNAHMLDGGTGSNGISNHISPPNNSGDAYSTQPRQQYQIGGQQALPSTLNQNDPNNSISQYLEQLQSLRQNQKSQLSHHPPMLPMPGSATMSPVVNKTSSQFFNQKQGGKQVPFGAPQINIKPLLQNQAKGNKRLVEPQDSPIGNIVQLNNDSNREISQDPPRVPKKNTLSNSGAIPRGISEVPKITTPSVDMYNQQHAPSASNKLTDQINFQKKINFANDNKTPFEKELEQKANEIKNQKKMITQEQVKAQKYKEDSISILKQLAESGSIVIQNDAKEQSLHQKKNSMDKQHRLVIDMGDGKKKVKSNIHDPRSVVNSPKQFLRPEADEEDENDQIMITQEEEQQIKEVISDLNHKAFYGKNLKRTKEVDCGDDESLRILSPRSREITTVMRVIQASFEATGEPPVTTTDFYRIGKMLGRGAFGKVNLAMHKLIRKLVAFKSLNKECLTDEAQKQKLMKEVSLLLKLRHNHVVKIYETIETDKHIIICMELCAGGDLLNYVRKRRRLKEPYAKVIFKQIIDGLCYIHSKFIAHRDIKLDNILLDGKGNVKIADFGVSKQCQKGQLRMTEQCGTPAYIAPEILKDKGYTFSVDIWSAGVVLFAMLYGTVPFKANNMEELHKLIVKGKYVLKDDISIEARNLLRGLLEVNPEKRLTIKQIYRHKWFEDLDPELQLFNDLERDMIRKEYTYNDPRRYNRNENEEPVDCFTEHNLESVYNSLKNVTSKSIILAPFNSTQSQIMEEGKLRESVHKFILEKMIVLKFARRCREIDRQYEFNNNGELDNGVYHKFINNSDENDDSGDERGNLEDVDKELLCVPMLLSSRREDKPDVSLEEDLKKISSKQAKMKEGQISREIHRNRKNIENELDAEMVQTFETFQTRYSNRLDQEKINKLVSHGYPREYVIKALEEYEPNYCTSGYYLLGMDQNYC